MKTNDNVTTETTKRAAEAREEVQANAPDEPILQFLLPRDPERTVALRRLLEAKDCAVRAVIFKSPI